MFQGSGAFTPPCVGTVESVSQENVYVNIPIGMGIHLIVKMLMSVCFLYYADTIPHARTPVDHIIAPATVAFIPTTGMDVIAQLCAGIKCANSRKEKTALLAPWTVEIPPVAFVGMEPATKQKTALPVTRIAEIAVQKVAGGVQSALDTGIATLILGYARVKVTGVVQFALITIGHYKCLSILFNLLL